MKFRVHSAQKQNYSAQKQVDLNKNHYLREPNKY